MDWALGIPGSYISLDLNIHRALPVCLLWFLSWFSRGLLFVLSKDKVAEAQSRHLIPNSKFPALRVHHSILVPIFGVTCLSHP